ncbi:MAG TPA: choline/ethanolamine kinase family protein [Steroidobacteraceae bacterium]
MRADSPPRHDPLAGLRAEAESALRGLLAARPATAPLATAPMTPVLGGLSNLGWRVECDARSHFVRLAQPATERLGADHHAECRVLGFACAAGIAPPVLCCDPESRLLVTEWVGVPDPEGSTPRAAALDAVARTLAALHGIDVPADLRRVDFREQALELEASLSPAGACTDLRDVAMQVFDVLRGSLARRVLCHHDLNPLNLVFDCNRRLWLVDWEYAGLGDPAFDLASYASQHGLDARQRARLAATYVAAGGLAVAAGRLERAAWAFDYVQWLWYRAALQARDSLADRALVAGRERRLAASLRGRASRVLRCNNEPFAGNETRV